MEVLAGSNLERKIRTFRLIRSNLQVNYHPLNFLSLSKFSFVLMASLIRYCCVESLILRTYRLTTLRISSGNWFNRTRFRRGYMNQFFENSAIASRGEIRHNGNVTTDIGARLPVPMRRR
jgi:hypothetical protein